MKKPIVMIVMDGVGIGRHDAGDAVFNARTPVLDRLSAQNPYAQIKAHGLAVGLPSDDDMGNSEVGHNALGCGQIYAQGAKLVNEAIETGDMFKGQTWKKIVEQGGVLHFIGLLSDGNVHSHIAHLKAMVRRAKADGVKAVRLHALLDGRDVPAQSCLQYIEDIENLFDELNDNSFNAKIASGGGRMKITMDRYEADWSMVKRGWETHVCGQGPQFRTVTEAVNAARAEKADIIDQDLPTFVIAENGEPVGKINDGDAVILFNFRGDRAIELSRAFDDDNFTRFDRVKPNVFYAGMLQYDGDLHIPRNFLVAPPSIKNTLSELLVKNNIKQYAISETQKFGHVTYFWNGNRNEKFSDALEVFEEVPSDKVSFDERPWMKCAEVTDKIIAAVVGGEYGFIRANFPNGDMVGHTGNYGAAVIGVEAVDLCLARIEKACAENGYALIVTADHGNADEMFEKNGKSPKTSHTLNPVPFIVVDADTRYAVRGGEFGLANAAATVALMLGLDAPKGWEPPIIEVAETI